MNEMLFRCAVTTAIALTGGLSGTGSAVAEGPVQGGARSLAEAGFEAFKNLAYGPETRRANLLDVYVPAGGREAGVKPWPVVVYLHGGGWAMGDKAAMPGWALTAAGFAAVGVNYRFSQEARFPAQIHDVKGAVRWVRAHAKEYNLDPDRIAVWGDSAGGHLASLLGTTGGRGELEGEVGGNGEFAGPVQAVLDWFGPTDFSTYRRDFEKQFPGQVNAAEGLAQQLFGTREESELTRLASPAVHVSSEAPPFLIVHGERDSVVPVAQSRSFYAALKKAGVEAELITLPGAGHGGPAFYQPGTIGRCLAFLKKTLKA